MCDENLSTTFIGVSRLLQPEGVTMQYVKVSQIQVLWFNFTSCPIEEIIQLKVLAAATW